jgi:hypothetical protein
MARYNFPVPTILGNIEPPVLPTDALPNIPATTTTLGGVKVDGTSITIDANGVISVSGGGGGGGSFWYGAAADPTPALGSRGEWFLDFRGGTWIPQYKTATGWQKATDVDKNFSLVPYIKKTIAQEHNNFVLASLADVVENVSGSTDAYDLFKSRGTPNIYFYGDQQKVVVEFDLPAANNPLSYINVGRIIGGYSRLLDGTTRPWTANVTAVRSSGVTVKNWKIDAVLADENSCEAFAKCASLVPDADIAYHGRAAFVDVFNDQKVYLRNFTPNAFLRRDAEDKQWELSYSSASLTTITSDNSPYTVNVADTDSIFWTTAAAVKGEQVPLFLDPKQNYRAGATIQILTSGDLSIQVVPLGEATLLDSGNPQSGGRKIGTSRRDISGNLLYIDTSASLLHVGNNQWVLRGASLEMGAPWIESATRPTPVWSPGKARVYTNSLGEDWSIISGMQIVALNIRPGSTEIVRDVGKDTRYYDWSDLVGGDTYEFSSRYKVFKGGQTSTVNSWNKVRYRIDRNEPSAPINVKFVGSRGARVLFTFDYDNVLQAPWTSVQAQAFAVDGSPVTNWVTMNPTKDEYTGNYVLQFAPAAKLTGPGRVKIRLVRDEAGKPTVIGLETSFIDINWDDYAAKVKNIKVAPIPRGSKTAEISWDALSTYDAKDCELVCDITNLTTGRPVSSTALHWSDTSTAYTEGTYGNSYRVKITPYTYGQFGIYQEVEFLVPQPF